MVLLKSLRQRHALARAGPRGVPCLVVPGLRHGEGPHGPQPQKPAQVLPSGWVARVVHRTLVLRQERIPFLLWQCAEDSFRIGWILR